METGLSDHKLVYTILNKKLSKPETVFTKGRCFKSFDANAFNKDLACVPFNVAYVFEDINDICWAWEKMYTDVLGDHAPIRMRKRKAASGQSKFITPEIRKAIRKRNSLKRKFDKTRKTDDWEAYRVLRNRVVSMRQKSVVKHFDHLCCHVLETTGLFGGHYALFYTQRNVRKAI